jgi:hypothetical protein
MKASVKQMTLASVLLFVMFFIVRPMNAEEKNACADDIQNFCSDVQAEGGHLAKCLKAHRHELSPGCVALRSQAAARARETHAACADDAAKFCKDVKPSEGGINLCLKDNAASLSNECREKLITSKIKLQRED